MPWPMPSAKNYGPDATMRDFRTELRSRPARRRIQQGLPTSYGPRAEPRTHIYFRTTTLQNPRVLPDVKAPAAPTLCAGYRP